MRSSCQPGPSVYQGRDENVSIDCHLGFSYDGPRDWDVRKRSER